MRIFYLQRQSIIDNTKVILPDPGARTHAHKTTEMHDADSVPEIFYPSFSGVERLDVLSIDPSHCFGEQEMTKPPHTHTHTGPKQSPCHLELSKTSSNYKLLK